MELQYMLNTNSGMLHIVGYCHNTTKTKPYHIKYFDIEDEAYHFGGRKVIPCTLCQNEKEKRMKEVL